MPQYGFVIDHRRCIGCHACTVACKSENDVPLGDFRTWVKYTEKGAFPEVKRHFTVLRCNHCDAAPCVEICPVVALHKRPDAIVDLDRDLCIGCRSCMQACPYDALYLNDQTGTAEKCHYCAHRTEIGLEPACVVVCPEQAIIAGDVSNEETNIAALLREQETTQRKVEKGTKPRVWYIDALEESLEPGRAAEPDAYIWSDRSPDDVAPPEDVIKPDPNVVTTLDVPHPPVWGWHIWTYLLTKNIAAGAGIIAPFLALLGASSGGMHDYFPEAITLVFLSITTFLLVHDLGRPERFLKILTHPNWNSWLVKGSYILMGFGGLATASIGLRLAGADRAADIVRWVNLPFALLASGYSAWLFAQCKGRDLWLEKGLFTSLLVRASVLGAGIGMLIPVDEATGFNCSRLFVVLAVVNAVLMFIERSHVSKNPAARAAQKIMAGSERSQAGVMLVIFGGICAQTGGMFGSDHAQGGFLVAALLLVVAGQFLFERAWIRAGQAVPIS